MHSTLPRFLVQARSDLVRAHPASHYAQYTDMAWCMTAALSMREAGIPVVFEAGRMLGRERSHPESAMQRPPYLFHCLRFHDPADPTEVLFTDMCGHETLDDIADAAASAYDWVRAPGEPLEMLIKELDAATTEAYYSEEFTGRLRAFLQSRSLEHTTAQSTPAPRQGPRL